MFVNNSSKLDLLSAIKTWISQFFLTIWRKCRALHQLPRHFLIVCMISGYKYDWNKLVLFPCLLTLNPFGTPSIASFFMFPFGCRVIVNFFGLPIGRFFAIGLLLLSFSTYSFKKSKSHCKLSHFHLLKWGETTMSITYVVYFWYHNH